MELKGYRAIRVPLSRGGQATQWCFVKLHREKGAARNSQSKTLFVANAPLALSTASIPGATDVREGRLGGGAQGGLRVAYVDFESVGKAKRALGEDSWQLGEKGESEAVLSRMVKRYRAVRPSAEQLREEVDAQMREFEEAEREDQRRRRSKQVDAEGFTLVTRKRRSRDDGMDGARRPKAQKKKKDYELKNFYRHQMREQKREELQSLREKFEEDKKRIQKMKEARKFKPF